MWSHLSIFSFIALIYLLLRGQRKEISLRQHGHTLETGKIAFQPIFTVQTVGLGLNRGGRIGTEQKHA
jgi:hypothetical protein